jgi:hypothetical protein
VGKIVVWDSVLFQLGEISPEAIWLSCSVVKQGNLTADATLQGFAKNYANPGIAFAMNTIKDQADMWVIYTVWRSDLSMTERTGSAQQDIDRQNDFDTALIQFFTYFKSWNSDYLQSIFSGEQANLTDIGNLVQNGMMLSVQDTLDLSSMTDQAQKILYSKLMLTAWNIAPLNGLFPLIL